MPAHRRVVGLSTINFLKMVEKILREAEIFAKSEKLSKVSQKQKIPILKHVLIITDFSNRKSRQACQAR